MFDTCFFADDINIIFFWGQFEAIFEVFYSRNGETSNTIAIQTKSCCFEVLYENHQMRKQ